MRSTKLIYEIRPSKYGRAFGLISMVLPLGHVGGYLEAAAAVRQAKSYSGSHAAVIRVYDDAGNVIETHEHEGDLKE